MSVLSSSTSSARAPFALPAANPPAAEKLVVGDWELTACLNLGRWTMVYEARPSRCPADWPADYALKLVRPDGEDAQLAKALLAREAQVGRSLSHPHVVTILTAQLEGDTAYLVMPRLAGQALDDQLTPGRPLAAGHAVWIARQAAEGLAALHQAGWIHGDLKPANLHVSPVGHATLLDLGLAHGVGEGHTVGGATLLGTLHYMPPERFTSALAADERSDLYSLGVMLYEMLTGYLPFAATSPAGWAEAHLSTEPIDMRRYVPTLHTRLVRLVRRLLMKEPLRRPQTAAEVVDRLVGLEIELLEEQFS